MRRLLTSFLVLGLLAGCGGNETTPPGDIDGLSQSDAEALEEANDDLAGLEMGQILQVGDCWGRDGEVTQDPIPCDGPHIFEVVGVVDDWDHEQYDGSFELGVAEDEATSDLCDNFAQGYLSAAAIDEGVAVDNARPKYLGHPEIVVCSAHSGPGVEPFRTEIEGSFADRGLR